MSGTLHIDLSNKVYYWAIDGKELFANDLEKVKELLTQDEEPITHVQLYGYDTEPELFKSIAGIICSSKFISIVDIEGNRLQNEGAEILKLFVKSSNISKISIASNWLENHGMDIAKTLVKSSFHAVDLSNNNFGNKEIREIQDYLKKELGSYDEKKGLKMLEEVIFDDDNVFNPYDKSVSELVGSNYITDHDFEA